jgi:hypothetical protein
MILVEMNCLASIAFRGSSPKSEATLMSRRGGDAHGGADSVFRWGVLGAVMDLQCGDGQQDGGADFARDGGAAAD